MSADPTPPPPPDINPSASSEGPVPPPVKRRYKRPDAGPAPASAEETDSEILVLSSLLQNLLARRQGSEGNETEGEVRAKVNRFVARGTSPVGGMASAVPLGPTPLTPDSADLDPTVSPATVRPAADGPEGMAAIAFPKFEPRTFQGNPGTEAWRRSGSTWGRGILYFAFAAALALAAFLAGRGDGRHDSGPPPKRLPALTLTAWSAPFAADLDRALAAEHSGDLPGARVIAQELEKNMGVNPWLSAYQAKINIRLGLNNDVEAQLSRALSSSTPPFAAAIFSEAQGFNYTRRRDFNQAIDCFAAVAELQPFDVTNLLHLAEAQRRAGRLTEGIRTFQQAIQRFPTGSPDQEDERAYLSFKARLSQVELGHDEEFKNDLEQQLKEPAPSPYWLLTAAAVALQKNDLPTAVNFLQKARESLAPARFISLTNDYFFRSFAHRTEINPFLTPQSVEQQAARRRSMEYFIDP